MSRIGGKNKTRPLGSLRHNSNTSDKVTSIPKLINVSETNIDNRIDEKYRGIQGSAMPVPPVTSRESSRRESTGDAEKTKHSARTSGSSSVRSQDLVDRKELKDALAREKDLKLTIADLEKLIEELRSLLAQREEEIAQLKEKLRLQEEEYNASLDKEVQDHSATRNILEETQSELNLTQERLDVLRKEMTAKLLEQRMELEKQHAEVLAEKDKEIATRDEKLNRLKHQMADALKGNSWERQQQLEELTKELARIQDEADLLRMKLKAISKNKPGSCTNCPDMMAKLDRAHLTVKDRDHTIRELKTHVGKLDKQLNQQDQLLKSWAESKGYKLPPLHTK